MVNEEEWKIHMTSDGRIEEDYQLRKVRFQSVISIHVWRKFTNKYFISYFYCKNDELFFKNAWIIFFWWMNLKMYLLEFEQILAIAVMYCICTLTCFVHFQHIFFGGLDPHLRHETWPFLLHYYPWDSTFEEREAIRNDRYIQYQDIRKMRYNTGFQILSCLIIQ